MNIKLCEEKGKAGRRKGKPHTYSTWPGMTSGQIPGLKDLINSPFP
jgi:hypothetical protein